MAANLKKTPAEKKDDKAPAEKKGVSLDLKWVLAGLGLVAITMGSVIIGIQLAPGKVVVKETVKREFVERIIKPGPSRPMLVDQVVNLRGGRYLRFSCVLQFAANEKLFPEGGGGGEGKKVDPLEQYEPLMKDAIVSAVSERSAEELLSPSGKEKLKEEIKKRINHELGAGDAAESAEHPVPEVIKVFFTNFVIS
jgi:flagellar basal body-associated protein FliL